MARTGFIVLCTLLVVAGCGRDSGGRPVGSGENSVAEVFDSGGASLGSVAFPVNCSEPAAESMRLGLALFHNMTYEVAESAFATAAEQDADCVLAYWGMAMTYFHPLWPDVPSEEALERGWTLLQEARGRGSLTAREDAYISALEAYYRDGSSRDERSRLVSYAEAWGEVHADHPQDQEAALLYALALTAAAPGADLTFTAQREAGSIVERTLAEIPDHPGAHHYLIHAYDSPPLAGDALMAARRYGDVAPENAHALHMTSHIFTRLGLWGESIEYNARSADAALAEPIAGAISHHHLHPIDYLVYAHLQRGEDSEARAILGHLVALDGPVSNHSASAYAFAAVPVRIALENQDWAMAVRVEARWPETIPWDQYPFLEAIPVFARALGAARTGDMTGAHEALVELAILRERAAAVPIAYDWETQVRIQELAVQAWIAYGEGRTADALGQMRESADLESSVEKNPVTPGEVLPARELLGDMLLELERYEEAQAAYEAALARSPNRFNSLYGAGRAAESRGDLAAASEFYGRLAEIAGDNPQRDRVDYALEFLELR